jgi:hypothetical protein
MKNLGSWVVVRFYVGDEKPVIQTGYVIGARSRSLYAQYDAHLVAECSDEMRTSENPLGLTDQVWVCLEHQIRSSTREGAMPVIHELDKQTLSALRTKYDVKEFP